MIMREIFENFLIGIGILCIIVTALIVSPKLLELFKKDDVTSIEQYCVVENKHTSVVLVGKVVTTKHYLDVYVEDAKKLHDSVLVPGALYEEIEIGTEIKCVIMYNNDELIGIEILK